MTCANDSARSHARLRSLVEFALHEGWSIGQTRSGHLRLIKPGLTPIHIGAAASDDCAGRLTLARGDSGERRALDDAAYAGDRPDG